MAYGGGGGGGGGGRGSDYVRKLRENLTCGLCLDVYNHDDRLPKVIPCQHSFCGGCLTGLLRANRGYTVPCPVCRESFRVPASARHHHGTGGVNLASFPTNLALKNLIDVLVEEEEVARRASRRLCPKHVANEVVMACQSCRVEVCAACLKTGGHYDHALEDLQTAYTELETEINKVLLPELKNTLEKYENNIKVAHDELKQWKDLHFDIIEGRAVALIAQICAWRDRNKVSVQSIHDTARERLEEEYNWEGVVPMKEEIEAKQQPSFSRLSELEKMKEELEEMADKEVEVAIPEVRLSDHVSLHLPDLLTVNTSNVAPSVQPAAASGLEMELVASLSLVEHTWLDSHPLHVYDAAGGTGHDVVLVTDTGLHKYELINGHFRQVWAKPLPRHLVVPTAGGGPLSPPSLYRAFVSACAGDVVVRAYPATACFDPYLERRHGGDAGGTAEVHSGDYGQLVGVGDDCLLYWNRPAVTVYALPGHQMRCQLAGARAEWTWVAVCVHPGTQEMAVTDWGSRTLSLFSAEGALLSTTSLSYIPAPYKSCAARGQHLAVVEYAGRGLRLHSWPPGDTTRHPESQEEITTHQRDITTNQRDITTTQRDITTHSRDITTSQRDITTHPRDITTSQRNITTHPRDITTSQRDITTHPEDITTNQKDITMGITTQQMGLAEGDEVTCCLGWGEDDIREGRTGSIGVLTMLINGNGTKRLVAYRVIVNDTVEEEEQEATLNIS